MPWSDLVEASAKEAGVSTAVAQRVLTAFRDVVVSRLAAEQAVRVPGLGTFSLRWVKGGSARSPATGRRVAYDGRHTARFSPAAPLKRALRALTPQPLAEPDHQRALRLAEALVADIAAYHPNVTPNVEGAWDLLVDSVCEDAFGESWTAARQRYDSTVPSEVRESRDYMLLTVRRRWGVPA